MWDVNQPAHPADMGHGPGSAGGAGVAGATPAAVCGPERGMRHGMHGAESTGARVRGWASTPNKKAKFKMRTQRTQSEDQFITNIETVRHAARGMRSRHAPFMGQFHRSVGIYKRHIF